MALSTNQMIFTVNVRKLIEKAEALGIGLTFGEAFRTQDQQLLYFHGRNIVQEGNNLVLTRCTRRSHTTKSNHLRRLAVDFNFFINGRLMYEHQRITELGAFWESLHPSNRWGGNFESIKDTPHFEMNAL